MPKTVLLTGASGFLGTAVAELLIKNGYDVKCMVRKSSLKKRLDCKQVVADINNPSSLKGITDKIDIVIHTAGLTKTLKYSDFYKVNFEGTKNLIDSLSKDVKQFIYVSSLSAAGPRKDPKDASCPISHYGKSKLMAENEIKRLKIQTAIIRPPALYGPYDKDFFTIFKAVKKGYAIIPESDNLLSLMYVTDAAKAILFVIENETDNLIYEIDDGSYHKQQDIIKSIMQVVNPDAKLIKVPIRLVDIMRYFAYTGIFGKLLNPDKLKEAKYSWVADSLPIFSKGFSAEMPLLSGLKNTTDWYEKNHWYK